MGIVGLHHLFLAPLIVFTAPAQALVQQPILATGVISAAGTLALVAREPKLSRAASISLLAILLWGKMVGSYLRLPSPDTAYLLFQFVVLLFFMEASDTVLMFDGNSRLLRGKEDETSAKSWNMMRRWFRSQLFAQAKFMVAAFALSLGLLVLGSLTSVSINQILVAGLLALFSVLALLFLMSYRREPEQAQP